MNKIKILDWDHSAARTAYYWLCEKYNIPAWKGCDSEFEREFRCKLNFNDRYNIYYIDFHTEEDYTLFLLKWS